MNTRGRLDGQVAFVTAGGGGIGRAIALGLAEAGADVAVFEIVPERAKETAARIRELGREALAIPGDAMDAEAIRTAIAATDARFGRLDILVNNAGGAHGHIGLARMDLAKWDRDIQLNLSAAQYCAQAALPHLRRSKGNVVNVSSLAGMHGTQGVGAYSAAKAGLQMLTRVMAAEWGPIGVRVNCVAPGMTATEAAELGWEKRGYDAKAVAKKAFPLGRYGEMREVAQAIAFFACDAASYITGESLAVGGGPNIGGMIDVEEDEPLAAL